MALGHQLNAIHDQGHAVEAQRALAARFPFGQEVVRVPDLHEEVAVVRRGAEGVGQAEVTEVDRRGVREVVRLDGVGAGADR